MNPSVDVGNPPRPFRHLRMAERRSPDPSSSRVPVHSALVQKSVTAITNPAGRLSIWMLGKTCALGKWKSANSWQTICNQSNVRFTNGLANRKGEARHPAKNEGPREHAGAASASLGPRKDLIPLSNCEFILRTKILGAPRRSCGASAARRRSLSDVKNSRLRTCGGGCPPAGARCGIGAALWHRDGIPVGRLDRHHCAAGGGCGLLDGFAPGGPFWETGVAPGRFLQPDCHYRPGSLHRLLRLFTRAARDAVAERCAGLLLGGAGRDGAVSESTGRRQRICLVASVRFCAGVHARA